MLLTQLENTLQQLYSEAHNKIAFSVRRYCEQGSPRGIEQMIGRQFGNFWEQLVLSTFKLSRASAGVGPPVYFQEFVRDYIKNTIAQGSYEQGIADDIERIITEFSEATGTAKMDLCDFTLATGDLKYAIDAKWRFVSNDAKTIRQIAFSARQLIKLGYQPVLLVRRPRGECLASPLDRFANNGWKVLHSEATSDFIRGLTGIDIEEWIEQNMDFWSHLGEYHDCLRAYQRTAESFTF